MSKYAVMPLSDYDNACDKIREKTETAEPIKSGEFAGKVEDVYNEGLAEGIEQGADVEKKRFWGILQDYGNRTNFTYAFFQWRVDIIDPQYDVRPINATNMLQQVQAVNGKNLNIPEIEAKNGIKFDFSKCTNMPNMIAWGAVEDLGFVDTTSCQNPNSAFSNSGYLKRLSIAIKEDGSQNFSGAFDYTTVLEDFTIVSGYFGSNLNFQWSTKLSMASITNIMAHLSDATSGLSVTFSREAVDNAFMDWGAGLAGSVSTAWKNLIATKPNWTIKLV